MLSRINDQSESALAALGLQSHRPLSNYIVSAASILSVGLLAGVGLGLLVSRRRGYEARKESEREIARTLHRFNSRFRPALRNARALAHRSSADQRLVDPASSPSQNGWVGIGYTRTSGGDPARNVSQFIDTYGANAATVNRTQ